jgi:PAN domain-containing protein
MAQPLGCCRCAIESGRSTRECYYCQRSGFSLECPPMISFKRTGRLMAAQVILSAAFFTHTSSYAQPTTFESNTNRPGLDYRHFQLPTPQPSLCRTACEQDQNCKAWTYVHPGLQGQFAMCWLKHAVPFPQPNACCHSGVRQRPAGPNTDKCPADDLFCDLRRTQ